MLPDLYEETRRWVRLLRDLGRGEDAESLDRGLYGATSGEALALIGAAVQSSLRSRPRLPAAVRDRLKRLQGEVDRVLRSPR